MNCCIELLYEHVIDVRVVHGWCLVLVFEFNLIGAKF